MHPDENENNNMFSKNKKVQLLNSIKENLQFLSPHKQEQAKKARKVMIALRVSTQKDLKAMIWINIIRNNEVTTEDVNITMKSFGPNVGSIKGKTTRQNHLRSLTTTSKYWKNYYG